MASREVMKMLREMGEVRGGPLPMKDRHRSNFLSALEALIRRVKRS